MKTLYLSFVLSLLCVGLVFAQEKEVSGTVTDGTMGGPLPGVNVVVQGTSTGTTTDAQGQYSLTVPGPDAMLEFSFVGYNTITETVGDRTTIDVTLSENVQALDEVVVVGYGTQRREEITGSVSSVDVADADAGQVTSTQDLIRGRVAGVQLQETSGEPNAGINLRVRGTSSISGGNEPLYVIDGIPVTTTSLTPGGVSQGGVTTSNTTNPLALINPQDIESIQILKDAASTAIYGTEGANGVVLIETKSGAVPEPQINYSGRLSTSALSREIDLVDASRYISATAELVSQEEADLRAGLGGSVDMQDEGFRRAVSQTHNLSFAAGNEQSSVRASLGFLDQEGILIDNGIQRYTGRVNAEQSAFDGLLNFDLNLTASRLETDHGFFGQGGGFEGGALKGIVAWQPTQPIETESGDFNEFSRSIRNPIALQRQIVDRTDQTRILGNFSASVEPIDGLVGRATLGLDYADAIRRSFIPEVNAIGEEIGGLARQAERELSNIVVQGTVNYDTEVAEGQTIRLLAGSEYKREVFQELSGESTEVLDAVNFSALQAALNTLPPESGKALVEQVSFFGRASYNYDNRYFATVSLRRDGSSVFGEDNKFAYFPAASVGWGIGQEEFLRDVEWLTQLKVRASVGLSGNQAIPPYQTLATLSPNAEFLGIFGEEETVLGLAPQRAANPDLQWEQTLEYNLGLDFTAWRLDGSLDVYQRTTTDLLLDINVPLPAVSNTVLQNLGEVQNRGIEFAVNAQVIDREDLSFRVGTNLSSNYNEITDLATREFVDHTGAQGAGQSGVLVQRLDEGHPIGAFYGPIFVGIENGVEVYEAEGGGTTSNLAEARRDFIGNPIPDFSYGLSLNLRYTNFDVSTFFRGEVGKDLFNNTALEFATKSNVVTGINVLEEALNDGTNADHVPVFSSRWIQNASFFRFDNLTIGYTFPDPERFKLRNARVYVSGQNLFVITPYDGYDPEVNNNINAEDTGFRALALPDRGVDYTTYPRSRTFTFGVDIGI